MDRGVVSMWVSMWVLMGLLVGGGVARGDGGVDSGTGCTPAWVAGVGGSGLDNSILDAVVFDDGSGPALYVAGTFAQAGGLPANRIARWDGVAWSALGLGIGMPGSGTVNALAVFDDGSGPALYAGGLFSQAGGLPAANIARWDGVSWSTLGSGVGGTVLAMGVFDDGSGPALYVGGQLLSAGGVGANRIARWDGTSWSPVGTGTNGQVSSLAVFDDGTGPALYAGGSFTQAGASLAANVARWDGAAWSALGCGLNQRAQALAVYDDGSGPALYAGGEFTQAGGCAANRMARWDGSSWAPMGSGLAFAGTGITVLSLAVYDDGSGPALYAGGRFDTAGGSPASRIARWDGSGWSALGTGVTGDVEAIVVFDDGSGPALFPVGFFTTAGGSPAGRIAKWQGCFIPPKIVTQPSTVLLPPLGGFATLSVEATGDELTYQWVRDGAQLEDGLNVSGATTPEVTVFAQGHSMTGLYFCIVTGASGDVVLSEKVVIAARPGCPGDLDANGVVDSNDLSILLGAFGAVCP